MNIFYVNVNPHRAARDLCDKHVLKMIVESAQMLCTAHRVLDGQETIRFSDKGRRKKYWEHDLYDDVLYKATHVNHPCNIWVREGSYNYFWLYQHFIELCQEYTFRYDKEHLSYLKLKDILKPLPKNITPGGTQIKLAMPNNFKTFDPVEAYRDYYMSKQHSMEMLWTRRYPPVWFS